MLGDMPSVRAAAEKPPLSTTFTKVAMLVMRSMSYATTQLGEDMFRRSVLIKLPAITFAHICGRLERGGGPTESACVPSASTSCARDGAAACSPGAARSLSQPSHHR